MFGVCCGLPLLASWGVTGVIAGVATGSWAVVAVASIVALIGALRWQRRRRCKVPARASAGVASVPTSVGTDGRGEQGR